MIQIWIHIRRTNFKKNVLMFLNNIYSIKVNKQISTSFLMFKV